jgi:hypothetical protein
MFESLRSRLVAVGGRVRRFQRRERRAFRRWLETTNAIIHISVVVLVPLLIAAVTVLSNLLAQVSFLLYPPLASGTYTLFADPEGRYASPTRFVGSLTAGAVCGFLALVVDVAVFGQPPAGVVGPLGAALAVFFTGLVTWALRLEEPAAFSTALLTLFVQGRIDHPAFYVLSIAVSSAIVAGGFYAWRELFYEERARYLYESTRGDDHVLVPMRGANPDATAMLAARLAAAHDAGKVVLLDLVADADLAAAERAAIEQSGQSEIRPDVGPEEADPAEAAAAVRTAAEDLEGRARAIETEVGVPCQVVVASEGRAPAQTVLATARETNCDLLAVPYEQAHGRLTPFVQDLFRGQVDVLVHRSQEGRTEWADVLVPVRAASDVAHSMVEFATRLAGYTGRVSVCTCIGERTARRRAERMLSDLVEPLAGALETRVSRADIKAFLAEAAPEFDLVVIGASRDRSAASRLVSPPTFERLQDLETDVAIVDRN